MLKKIIVFNCIWLLSNCGQKPKTAKVIQKKINETVYASGNVESNNQYQVISLVSGYIRKINYTEGDKVNKNEILFEIANESGTIALKNATLNRDYSDYNQNKNKVKELKVALQAAKTKWNNDSLQLIRKKLLVENNVIPSNDLDNWEVNCANSKSNYISLSLQIEDLIRQLKLNDKLGKTNFEQSSKMANDYLIKSEINGVVFSIFKKTGDLVTPQSPIAIIGSEKKYVLKLQVDEYDITKIKINQKIKVKLDSYKGKVFDAYVSKIAPLMNEKSKTFTVEAKFSDQPSVLYPNLTLEANIIIKSTPNALLIPREFLIDGSYVILKNSKRIKVKTGIMDLKYVEVISGLSKNDEITLQNEN